MVQGLEVINFVDPWDLKFNYCLYLKLEVASYVIKTANFTHEYVCAILFAIKCIEFYVSKWTLMQKNTEK